MIVPEEFTIWVWVIWALFVIGISIFGGRGSREVVGDMRFIQKQIEVDARQFTTDPENGPDLAKWITQHESNKTMAVYWEPKQAKGLKLLPTLTLIYEDKTQDEVWPGDWLVLLEGDFFVYSDADFRSRFEAVAE